LAVGTQSGSIALWTQAELRKGEGYSHKLQGHHEKVVSVAFSGSSQQQQLLASGSLDWTVRLWDTHTRECVAVLEGHTWTVLSVAFSPDGRLLASASYDGTVQLWDVVERRATSPIDVLQHTDWVWSVSFSPDGRQLASGSSDCKVRLWSVPEGVPGPVLQHARDVFCVAFSPVVGSNVLATGSSDHFVRLWDVSGINQHMLCELQGHSDYIMSVAFSPDGSQLVSGSCDGTLRLWSVATSKLLKVLIGHSRFVHSVAFHPNGKQVASCSSESEVCMWTVCEWSDRVNHLFDSDIMRVVFLLMCIKARFDKPKHSFSQHFRLSMYLWLQIISYYVYIAV
jgi:WD40 repeat protein